MKKLFLILGISVLLFSSSCNNKGCKDSLSSKTAPASEVTMVENYITSYGITATKHSSGAYYTIVNPGTGDAANFCASVNLTYKGSLTDGSVFDENTNPVSFTLSNLIYGWQALLPLIKAGGEINMYIPPSLGYGAVSQPNIPANSVLIFNVKLVSVTNP